MFVSRTIQSSVVRVSSFHENVPVNESSAPEPLGVDGICREEVALSRLWRTDPMPEPPVDHEAPPEEPAE